MTHSDAADFLAKTLRSNPAYAAWLASEGFELRTVKIVRFNDDRTSDPWFYRKCTALGWVLAEFDGPRILGERAVLNKVREDFGPEAYALY
jgi:hypothetical protein